MHSFEYSVKPRRRRGMCTSQTIMKMCDVYHVFYQCVIEAIWCAKDWVSLCWTGWTAASIHRCYPATDRYGGFDLLRFRPGPVHPSLGDLVIPSSPKITISAPNLAWTPVRHSALRSRTPDFKRSASLSLPDTWITGARHCTRRRKRGIDSRWSFGYVMKLFIYLFSIRYHLQRLHKTFVWTY